jgi:hypothetical protein
MARSEHVLELGRERGRVDERAEELDWDREDRRGGVLGRDLGRRLQIAKVVVSSRGAS